MIKFPYGDADFCNIITDNYFFVDRTAKIRLLEQAGKRLLFLRPRRFGKSLWLSVLENYYDVRKADEFERLFGHLAIGQNPTHLHNQYLIFKWNFSTIATVGTEADMRQAIHDDLNSRIRRFLIRYETILQYPVEIHPHNALASLSNLLAVTEATPYKVYLLIDEYDNFANTVLMSGSPQGQERYEKLVTGEGMLKTIFKAVKEGLEGQGIDRLFITGVSPLVLSDITSGFNVAKNISLWPQFNDLCGFWETEVAEALAQVGEQCQLTAPQIDEALTTMRTFYDGYAFHDEIEPKLYNPTLTFYFLDYLLQNCRYPRQLLDSNMSMDSNKISYIAQLPQGEQVISQALNEANPLTVFELEDQFGLPELLQQQHDQTFMVSLLYYFGVITLTPERTRKGKLKLRIPNLVIRKLYVERINKMILPDFLSRQEADRIIENFYSTGDLGSVCDYVLRKQFTIFDNRDLRWTNELTVKTLFLTLLFNDTAYIMDSEPALQRGYGDLIMLVRPDMRQFQLLDFLIEFKYVPLGKNKLTGKQVRGMSEKALLALKAVKAELATAKQQLISYRHTLNQRYGQGYLRLRTYTVVSVGYDRLVWQEVLLPDKVD
ncbi:AAA family ATPase [Anaerolineales bacterium HSG24]|nr:AAA family ATPase [Anaerolineales bacterium HSG24]